MTEAFADQSQQASDPLHLHPHPGWHALHAAPAWQPQALGQPLPDDPHAVSVALPTWRDIVGYEENEARVHQALRSGYPRFVLPPLLLQLGQWLRQRHSIPADAVVYPYRLPHQAEQALRWIQQEAQATDATAKQPASGQVGLLSDTSGVVAIHASGSYAALAKAYWQHSGQGLSTRAAEMVLTHGEIVDDVQPRCQVRAGLGALTGVPPERIFLYPSGMAAYFAAVLAVEAVQAERHAGLAETKNAPSPPWAQIGFPYVDIFEGSAAVYCCWWALI